MNLRGSICNVQGFKQWNYFISPLLKSRTQSLYVLPQFCTNFPQYYEIQSQVVLWSWRSERAHTGQWKEEYRSCPLKPDTLKISQVAERESI